MLYLLGLSLLINNHYTSFQLFFPSVFLKQDLYVHKKKQEPNIQLIRNIRIRNYLPIINVYFILALSWYFLRFSFISLLLLFMFIPPFGSYQYNPETKANLTF